MLLDEEIDCLRTQRGSFHPEGLGHSSQSESLYYITDDEKSLYRCFDLSALRDLLTILSSGIGSARRNCTQRVMHVIRGRGV